jgi:phage baseplate assembly protein W
MIDIKILTIKDLLPINKVEFASRVVPLSVVIQGERLDQASSVFINDIEAPEFAVLSKSRLLVQIPTSERLSLLRKVAVIATVPAVNRRSLLHFEIGDSVKGISGLGKLVQAYCKQLIQTPGTDRFRPNEGGGLLKLVGRNVSKGDSKNLQASVIGAIGRARDQLIARQNSDRRIPADERLLNATAEAVGFDASTTTLTASIALSAVSGRQAVANLTL